MKKTLFLQLILVMFFAWSCSQKNDNQLRVSTPESVKISSERLNRIDTMLIQSINKGGLQEQLDL